MTLTTRTANIASYVVKTANEYGRVDHLKLQKLLYYVDAWHLVYMDKPLIHENFEAWIHGPVLRSVYRKYGADLFASVSPLIQNPDVSWMTPEEKTLVDDVIAAYAKKTSYELECMTHAERPWLVARRGLKPTDKSTNPISKSISKQYYRQLLQSK